MPYPVAAARGRSSGAVAAAWSPLSLGTTRKGWWDFSDATTLFTDAGTTPVSADGDAIYRVNDKSGNAKHANMSNPSLRPIYKTAILNGESVGRSASDEYVELPEISQSTSFCMVVVARSSDNTGTRCVMDNRQCGVLTRTGGGKFGWYLSGVGYVDSSKNSDTDPHIIITRRSGGALSLFVDGGNAVATSSVDINAPSGAFFLGRFSSGLSFIGDIAEAFYLVGETADDTNKLGAWLATKYAITWADVPT